MDAIEYQKKYPYYKPLYERFIEQFGKDTKVPSDIDVVSFINSAYRGIPLRLKDMTPFTVNEQNGKRYIITKDRIQYPLIYLIENATHFIPVIEIGSGMALLLGDHDNQGRKILHENETVEVDKIYGVSIYIGRGEIAMYPYAVKFIFSWIDENRVTQNQIVKFSPHDKELSFHGALIKIILRKRCSGCASGDVLKLKELFN